MVPSPGVGYRGDVANEGAVVGALLCAPRGDLSADERDALDEVAEEPARWLTTDEIRAALGDSPTPKLPGRLAG